MAVPTQAGGGLWLTLLLSVLLGFASISTDFYLPALPSMAGALGASQGMLELTVSGYLLGFSFGQLCWGPVSDKIGRKLPLLAGICIFMLGAAGCALATDVWMMIGWRVVQALGASAAVVLARAMVRDLFSGDEAARMLSTLMMIMGIAPMVGPIAGAQILAWSSWQYIFWTLVLVGALTLIGVLGSAETLPTDRRSSGSKMTTFSSYLNHFKNVRLMGYAAVFGLYCAGMFAYVAGSPFLFIRYFGLAPQFYGIVFASGIVGIIVLTAVNRRLIPHYGSDRLLAFGLMVGAGAGLALVVFALTGMGGAVSVTAALFVFVAVNGLIGANAIAGGLNSVSYGTGAASSILGFAQYGGGMVGSASVSATANGTPVPMALVIFGCGLIAMVMSLVMLRKPVAASGVKVSG